MKTLPKLCAALVAASALSLPMVSTAADGLRPEVAKPLQAAGELLRAGKAREALAKVNEANAVPGKNAAEQLMIDRMRGSAAQRAGDNATAIQSFESAFNSGRLSGGEQAQIAESLAFAYSQQQNWAKTSQWAQKAKQLGANSAQLNQLMAYVQSQSGDYSAIARDSQAAVSAAEQAGRKPAEDDLLRLADAQQRMNNMTGYVSTLEKLVLNYPKKDYWQAYLGRLPRKSGFSDRLSLDVMRLRLATGNLTKTDEYMEMAQLALQAELPAEGKRIVDSGFSNGVLGTGQEAARHQRLQKLAVQQEAEQKAALAQQATEASAAKDGNELVNVGMRYASFGEYDRGIQLIEQGIAKGGLKRPEDAKLRLGVAMVQSGKNRQRAVQVLRTVQGTDGLADVARAWAVVASTQ